jgi:hypothetical protein
MKCREALALAQDLQQQRVTVALDCLPVVNHLARDYAGNYTMVLREIKELASLLVEASFRHENRASNCEAHRLARSAVSAEVGRRVWLLEPPDGLSIVNNVLNQ